MGLSAKLFFDNSSESETLYTRVTLSDEQLQDARDKKDKLLELIKPELRQTFDVSVGHWLQGSYKNHTLIRPVQKGDEFDIDVGIYLFLNAEEQGLQAEDAKAINRRVLEWFASRRPEAKVEESKANCERLSYPESFHIDIPLYYFDKSNGTCRLATQNQGWIDSDPKSLQDWFDRSVSKLSQCALARLRRIIKYLKTWTALKSKRDGVRVALPSIAITILAVRYFHNSEADDDSFISTVIPMMNYLLVNDTVSSPIDGSDVLDLNDEELANIRKMARALRDSCEYIQNCEDSFQQFVLWNATFEHMFPPFVESFGEVTKRTNLPAITTPPIISVRQVNKKGQVLSNGVKDTVDAYRDEKLYFQLVNQGDYRDNVRVHWIVRNQDCEARNVNDLGHTTVLEKSEENFESCAYSGIHYMECLVLQDGNIAGISAVKVNIRGFSRPLRNPPKKKQYQGP